MVTATTIIKGYVGDGYTSDTQPETFPDATAGLEGYNYRKPINYTGGTGAGTNYQLIIKCYYGSGTDGTETLNGEAVAKVYLNQHCKTDFSDVRFALQGASTEYVYKLCSKTDSDNAVFAVKVSDSLDSARVIYVYSGNPSASSASSDDTFIDTIASGLEGAWSLNEALATDAVTDYSGNSKNGTNNGGAKTTGKFRNGTQLDGVSNYINIPDSMQFGVNPFSVAVWIKPSEINRDGEIFNKNTAFNDERWELRQLADNTVRFLTSDGGATVSVASTSLVTTSNYMFLVATRSGTTIKLYVNGAQEGGDGTIDAGASFSGTRDAMLGRPSEAAGVWFKGIVDEPLTFTAALTPAQITNLYTNYGDPSLIAGKITVRKQATTTAPAVSTVGKLETRKTNLAYKVNEITNRAEAAGKSYTVASTARGHMGWAVIVTEV